MEKKLNSTHNTNKFDWCKIILDTSQIRVSFSVNGSDNITLKVRDQNLFNVYFGQDVDLLPKCILMITGCINSRAFMILLYQVTVIFN